MSDQDSILRLSIDDTTAAVFEKAGRNAEELAAKLGRTWTAPAVGRDALGHFTKLPGVLVAAGKEADILSTKLMRAAGPSVGRDALGHFTKLAPIISSASKEAGVLAAGLAQVSTVTTAQRGKPAEPIGAIAAAAKRAGITVDEMRQRVLNASRQGTQAFGETDKAAQGLKRTTQDSTRTHEQHGNVITSISRDLLGMAAGYMVVHKALSITKESFVEFANQDERLRILQNKTGATRHEIDHLNKTLTMTSNIVGRSTSDLSKGFEALRESGFLTTKQAEDLIPKVAGAARAFGVETDVMARGLGAFMNNLGVSGDKAGVVLDMMVQSSAKFNLNLAEVAATAPHLSEAMSHFGYSGEAGVNKLLSMLAILREHGFASTSEAATHLNTLLLRMGNNDKLTGALGIRQGRWVQTLENVRDTGGDVIEFWVSKVKQAQGRGQTMEAMFPLPAMRKAAQAIIDNYDKINDKQGILKNSAGAAEKALKNVAEGPKMAIDKLSTSFGNMAEAFGEALDAMGGSAVLNEITRKVKAFTEGINESVAAVTFLKNLVISVAPTLPMTGAEATKMLDKRVAPPAGAGAGAEAVALLERKLVIAQENLDRVAGAKGTPAQRAVLEERLAALTEELKRTIAAIKESEEKKAHDENKIPEHAKERTGYAPGGLGMPGGYVIPGSHSEGGGSAAAPGGGAVSYPQGSGGGVGSGGSAPSAAAPAAPPSALRNWLSSGKQIPGTAGISALFSGRKPTTAAPGGGVPTVPSGGGGSEGPAGGAAAWDRMTKGTPLEGKWPQVEAAAREHNVPPSVMGGVIAHETGRGANTRGNNVAGLMDPKTNWMTKQQFGSVDEGIGAAGRTIGKQYTKAGGDLDRMGRSYAPVGAANDPGGQNAGWAGGVASHAKQLGGLQREAALTPPTGTAGVMSTPGAGGGVSELQSGIRRQPISPELKQQLTYAGQQAGVTVDVHSGGQPSSGLNRTGSHRHDEGGAADVKLRDAKTGRILDMSNPEDAARMSQFTEHAVRAGATGVGAGPGYMGSRSIHVGGGKPATWGGAPWVAGAHQRGMKSQMTPEQIRGAIKPPEAPAPVAAPAVPPTAPAVPPTAPAPTATPPADDQAQQIRSELEKPIVMRTKLDSTDMQFRRASMRRETDRELREARWDSYHDIGAA